MVHPLVFGIALIDLLALGLLFAAARRAEPVLRRWAPGAASEGQLRLERGMEAASLFGRGGAALLGLGSLAVVLAVASVLPSLVPGAMCGTGVIEATDGLGRQALTLRGLAMLLLAVWYTLDRLDRAAPQAPLAPLVALAIVVATPLGAWAVVDTLRALWSLDTHGAVDCCAAIYAEATVTKGLVVGLVSEQGLALFAAGAAALILVGGWLGLRPRARGAVPLIYAGLVLLWVPLAGWVLIEHFAAYHYEVLAHHCPWCLFLPEHDAIGYLLFGALTLALLEGGAIGAATLGVSSAPEVHPAAVARVRSAARRITLAAAIFLVAAVGPALAWYWRFGVWMHG